MDELQELAGLLRHRLNIAVIAALLCVFVFFYPLKLVFVHMVYVSILLDDVFFSVSEQRLSCVRYI